MEIHNLEQIILEIEKKIEYLKNNSIHILNLTENIKSLSDDLNFQVKQIYNLLYALENELKKNE
jgi:stage III sporulation protein SpoIIIAA